MNRVVARRRLRAETVALARRIALIPPVTASLVKESINHTFEEMGKSRALKYHFMLHQFMHSTETAQRALAERQRSGGMRAMLKARDRAFTRRSKSR